MPRRLGAQGLIPALVLSAMLGGCSDLYWDRRETVTVETVYDQAADRVSRLLWTGSRFIVVHAIEHSGHAGGPYDSHGLDTLQFDAATMTISQTTPLPFGSTTWTAVAGAALSPDGITYAWVDLYDGYSIVVAQTKADGTLLRPKRTVIPRTYADGLSYTDIAWDGSKYLLVWLEAIEPNNTARKLRALHLDRNLDPIESAPFDVFSVAGPLTPPRLVPTPNGVLVVYSRSDLENSGGAARAFARSIDAASRRRVAH